VGSSQTPAPGSSRGKIAVFDVPLASLTYQAFLSISYRSYDPGHVFTPTGVYARPWLGIGTEITLLDTLAAGPAGDSARLRYRGTSRNYITGPSYLLNWGIPTMDQLDLARMRREAIAFTQMLLDLSRVPAGRLRRLDLMRR
jgi:hypothetical protein